MRIDRRGKGNKGRYLCQGYFNLKKGREGKREESRKRVGKGDQMKLLSNERRGWNGEKFVAVVLQF